MIAERFDLLRDISFETRVAQAEYDGARALWCVSTVTGEQLTARGRRRLQRQASGRHRDRSTGIQAIPVIAAQAAHLTVGQRTPQLRRPCPQ